MTFCVVGCSHQNATIEQRERLAFSQPQIAAALARVQRLFPEVEAVILSTCNRVELYTATQNAAVPSTEDIAGFFAEFHGRSGQSGGGDSARSVVEHLYRYTDARAVEHLFNVAAGLDSMVVGETQILAQVKQAYQSAIDCSAAGPLSHAAFQAALKAARRVACHTAIQKHRVSVPSVAVADFAARIFERFDDKSTLVIGAGEMAEETLNYLRDEGVRDVAVTNRNRDRAADLASRWDGRAIAWENLDEALAAADLVVSTTAATEPIVTLETFKKIHARRGGRPLFILDLAVPRDFEPAVGELPEIFLYSIDDLKAACEENRRLRDKELPAAAQIIAQEVENFLAGEHLRASGPVIGRLRDDWQKPKEEELDRLLNKINVPPETEAEIRRSFDRLINKLLHTPLKSLREESRQGIPSALIEALSKLFQLKD